MREILFRGKTKNTNEWVYGDLVRLKDGNKEIPHIYGFGEVIPETVGQYIGLDDKNGKKIFEGDIVRYLNTELLKVNKNHTGFTFIVVFYDGAFSSLNTKYYGTYGQHEVALADQDWGLEMENCEVIGNIHDDGLNELDNNRVLTKSEAVEVIDKVADAVMERIEQLQAECEPYIVSELFKMYQEAKEKEQ